MRKIRTRYIPHLLKDEQEKARGQCAVLSLKELLNYNAQSFANVVSDDKSLRLINISQNENTKTRF
jgi:hypothetical protein